MKKTINIPQISLFTREFKISDLSWLRWIIILGVLGLSFLSFTLAARLPLKYLIGGILVGIFSLIALRNMTLTLTLVLLTSATSGIVIGTGRATPLPAGLLMIALLSVIWLIRMMLFEHRISLKPSPLNSPLFAFLIAALISWIIGYVIWDWQLFVEKNIFLVQAGQYALFLFSFMAMFLTAHQDLSEKDLRTWMLIVVVIGLSEMLVEILLGIYRGREMGITGSLFIFPLILLAAQAFFNPKIKSSSRVAIILVGLFWCYWAYTNRVWKGGWAPVLVGLAVLAFIYSWRLTLLGSGVVAALVVWKWDFLSKMLLTMEVETTSTIRPYIWRDIANLVLPRSPVFGLGLANYKYYWNIPGFVPLSRIAAGWDKWNAWGYAIPSHNMFMDIFAQTGLLGIGLFLWGMGILLWIIIQVSRNLKPGFLRAYVLGVLAGFIAMLVGSFLFADWLIPFVYNITITGFRHSVYSWILVGSVVGIYYKQKEKRDASSS